MKVFVTGATGYIGRAVASTFRRAGHAVYGLVRSDSAAKILQETEIVPIVGSLEDAESYTRIAEKSEVIIHCAFESSERGVERDGYAIDTLLAAAKKSDLPRIFLYTSGVWVYGNTYGKIVDEATPLNPLDIVKWRPSHEEKILKAASNNLRSVVIRPGCVYGGVGGLTRLWFDSIAENAVTMIGDGHNRWSMVHLDDLAQLYLLAAEKELNGVILNATDGSQLQVKEIVSDIAAMAGIPDQIRVLSPDEALNKLGGFTQGLMVDQMVSSQRAQRLLGWHPRHLSFLYDLERYYEAWKAVYRS